MKFLDLDRDQALLGGMSIYGFTVWTPNGGGVTVERDGAASEGALFIMLYFP
jgi:hypothetical protein